MNTEEESFEELETSLLALCQDVADEKLPSSLSYDEIVNDIYRLCGFTVKSPKRSIISVELDDNATEVVIDLTHSDDDGDEFETETKPPSCVENEDQNLVVDPTNCEIKSDDNSVICEMDIEKLPIDEKKVDHLLIAEKEIDQKAIGEKDIDNLPIDDQTMINDFSMPKIDYISKWLKMNDDGSDSLIDRMFLGDYDNFEKSGENVNLDLEPLIPIFTRSASEEEKKLQKLMADLLEQQKSEIMKNLPSTSEIDAGFVENSMVRKRHDKMSICEKSKSEIGRNGDRNTTSKKKNFQDESWKNIPSTSKSQNLGSKFSNGNEKVPVKNLSKFFSAENGRSDLSYSNDFQENSPVFRMPEIPSRKDIANSGQKFRFSPNSPENSTIFQTENFFQNGEFDQNPFSIVNTKPKRQNSRFPTNFQSEKHEDNNFSSWADDIGIGHLLRNVDEVDIVQSKEPQPEPQLFVSDDPEENEDNNDPEWKITKMLDTDDERYRQVRQKWQNVRTPDPNLNLTTHNFWKRRLESKGVDVINRFGKRQFVNEKFEEKRKKMRRCTDAFDAQIEMLEQDWKVDETKERKAYEEIRKQFTCAGDLNKLRKRHSFRLQDINGRYRKDISDLVKVKDEVLTFQKFYSGLRNSCTEDVDTTLVSVERVDEMIDTEEMYSIYEEVYGSSEKSGF